MSAFGLHILIFLPLAAAVVVWVWPWREERVKTFSLIVGLITLLVALLLWLQVPQAGPTGLVGETHPGNRQ
jgi:NADH:ubiquinone oxidoreductase subunit 4 (subunit M)